MTASAFYPLQSPSAAPLEGNLSYLSQASLSDPFASSEPKNHLVVIDSAVDNIEQLTANLEASQVVILAGDQDGIAQITQAIASFDSAEIDSLHIFSHADAGVLQLGNSDLDAARLNRYADEMSEWGEAIAPEGDILLYGCNLAAGSTGQHFIEQLSGLTGADVAASDDLTGVGGDWDLEVTAGSIEAQVILDTITQGSYSGTLATYDGKEYVLTSRKTWEDAQAEAQRLGGNLVTINSAAEEVWIQQNFGSEEAFWIGLSDQAQEGVFQWANGEAVTYTNWAPGEPNDWQGNQDYGRINFGSDRQWDDDQATSLMRGIVEIDPTDANPGITEVAPDITPRALTAPETAAVSSYDVREFNGSYYWLADAQTWEVAQAEARATGSNLVTINSAAEDDWLKQTFGTDESFWMGMSDADQEGTFKWASGEAITYTNWAPGEPSDWQGTQDYGNTNFGQNQQWDDNHVYSTLRGIIEWGSNAPVLVIENPEDPVPQDGVFSRIVPVNYSGYNTDAVEFSNWGDAAAVSELGNAARNVGAQTLRLPGGDGANYWDWDIGGIIEARNPFTMPFDLIQPLPLSLNYQHNTNATLRNIKPLIDSSGAEPIWVVNMNTSSLEKEIRHLVEAKQLGFSVNRIELGNELYFALPNYTRSAGTLETAEAYAQSAKDWALAIKSTPELANTTIAITGAIPDSRSSTRVQSWWSALTTPTGADNRSAIDVVDAFTIHPYYSGSNVNVQKSDVGDRTRAGQIARDGIALMRQILDNPALDNAAIQNKQMWITEHNILENDEVILGNSWVHALLVDFHTQEFLKDERTAVSTAHVLTGNPQWQAITNEKGSQIDGNQRGITDLPFTENSSERFQPTALGLVLKETAEVFDSGTATLLKSGESFIAWRVTNSVDNISAVNADDRSESLALPTGRDWEVRTYTGDPWKTVARQSDLDVTVQTFSGGQTITIPGFSKVVATAR